MWAINPMAIVICTRGSADSITNYLVLSSLRYTLQRQGLLAGLLCGLVVHLRLYPIIYAPAFALHLLCPLPPSITKGKSDTTITKAKGLNILGVEVQLGYPIAGFIIGGLVGVLSPSLWAYKAYGDEYLQHSLLYHFTRADHRHNFSVHFYGIYLDMVPQPLSSDDLSTGIVMYTHNYRFLVFPPLPPFPPVHFHLLHFLFISTRLTEYLKSSICTIGGSRNSPSQLLMILPQLLLLAMLLPILARVRLPLCMLLQTMVFVTYVLRLYNTSYIPITRPTPL